MNIRSVAAAASIAMAVLVSPASRSDDGAGGRVSGVLLGNLNRASRPQDDLFDFANGTWLRDVPIPADRSRYGVDSLMLERSLVQQRALLEHISPDADASTRKAGVLYASFMDDSRLERERLAPLAEDLKAIRSIRTLADASAILGRLESMGVSTPIDMYVQPDAKDTKRYALWITQGGLGLPDRDYYTNTDQRFSAIREKYRTHIATILRLAGDPQPERQAAIIFALEAGIAQIQWTVVNRRDPEKTYNPRSLSAINSIAPSVDWERYIEAAGVARPSPLLIVRQPDYLQALSALLRASPLASWREYLRFRLLSDSAPYLTAAFVDEDFAFNEGVLHDTPKLPERWKRGCELVDRLMGDALGKLYVDRFFPVSSKVRVDEMVRGLFNAYADSIQHLGWLSPATREQALIKLDKIQVRIGYPAEWHDYSALTIEPKDLWGNVYRGRKFEMQRQLSKLTGTVDRGEWEMTAPTVDAGYTPGTNSIEFPAGVLQPPLYVPSADDAYNYGSTGATIGHEISHAFDNRGSQYDGEGALHDWWTTEDHARFKSETDKLVAQFDSLEPLPGFHVNGTLTLPENIADLVGLEIAYKAYLASLHGREAPVIDGFTGAQRFFIGYAQSFLGKRRDSLLIAQLKSNPHAPEKDRVNGIAPQLDGFYEAFSMMPGDKMFIAPGERVHLW
jgi:putative endopeptidase